MPFEKYLKITYHNGAKKINAYLKMPSSTFAVLQREITMCLFEERALPRCDLKTFWIDEDGDEIEIFNQCDYDIFMSKRSERQHLQVAPLLGFDGRSTPTPPPRDDPAAFVTHHGIECDSCGMESIVGFRYKCIECPDYDLCQKCEAAHMHSEHMMLRMPDDNCPTTVEAWVTGGGRCGRGRPKRGKAGVPFMGASPQTGGVEPDDKQGHPHHHHHHHGRKHRHQRYSMRNGIFHHLYDMMQDLAEGGANAASAAEGRSDPKASESAGKTATGAQNAANEAARRATQEAAETARSMMGCAQRAFDFSLPQQPTTDGAMPAKEQPQQQKKDITVEGATPKTPPSTLEATTATGNAAQAKQSATKENAQPQCSIPHAVPVMSPTLENLAQFVDPQYMKAGIQIMNNFSEMFAKMLDPGTPIIDAAANTNQQPLPQQRKTSSDTSSITSSVADTSAQCTRVEQPTIKQMPANVEQPGSAEPNSVSLLESQAPVSNTSIVSTNPFDQTVRSERSHSDDDWQLIDTQQTGTPNGSFASVTTSTSTESIDGAVAGANATKVAATLPTAATAAPINYEQLSKDLRAHVLEEQLHTQKLQTQMQQQQQQSLSSISTTSNASTSTTTTEVTAPPNGTEETRAPVIYHNDAVINSAVHAMMTMGFSNEGAYLTQLLDSVNGNIAEALDIMTAAQRSSR